VDFSSIFARRFNGQGRSIPLQVTVKLEEMENAPLTIEVFGNRGFVIAARAIEAALAGLGGLSNAKHQPAGMKE